MDRGTCSMQVGREKEQRLEVPLYLFSEDVDFKNAAAMAYRILTKPDVQNKRKAFLRDVDPFYPYDDEEGAEPKICRNATTLEMAGVVEEIIAMDQCLRYLIDALIEEN